MDATGTSANNLPIDDYYTTYTSAGAVDTSFGISPIVATPRQLVMPTPIDRKYKDKNGCVKKSYWKSGIGDFRFTGIADLSAYTISTSSLTNISCGDSFKVTVDDTAALCAADACV